LQFILVTDDLHPFANPTTADYAAIQVPYPNPTVGVFVVTLVVMGKVNAAGFKACVGFSFVLEVVRVIKIDGIVVAQQVNQASVDGLQV
jgi:hypothetical protein